MLCARLAIASVLLTASLTSSLTARAAPFEVGVSVSVREGSQRELAGVLEVGIPLERLGAPLPAASRLAQTAYPEVSAPPADPGVEARESPPRPPVRAVSQLPAAFARELVQQALRVQGHGSARARLDAMSTRARVAALLPELTLRAARSNDQSLRLQPEGVDRYDLTQTGGADLLLEARARWNLDRLVFADDELRIEQLRVDYAQSAERLALLVLKHLFSWQRARARLSVGDVDPEDSLALELDMLEAGAALDVLTDGVFSRRLAERERRGRSRSPR